MMINQVTLIGRLTRDAECTEGAQTRVARMRIATDGGYRDAAGTWQERADFHTVVAFGRLADVCSSYCVKGRLVYIAGRLRTRDYDGNDGLRRHTTEIIADVMKLLGRPAEEAASAHGGPASGADEADGVDTAATGETRSSRRRSAEEVAAAALP